MFSIRWNHRGNWHFGHMQKEFMENIIFFISLLKELFLFLFFCYWQREPFNYQILKNAKKVHQKSCIMILLYFPVQESNKFKKWKMKTMTRKPKRSFESKKRHFWRFWNINSRTVDHIIWTISNDLTTRKKFSRDFGKIWNDHHEKANLHQG